MSYLLELCLPHLLTREQYLQRLDGIDRSLPSSDDENIQRGKRAMRYVLDNQKDVTHAMYRSDLGWIDFVWGDVGITKASGKTKGGKGIAHILEARQRKDGLTAMQARAQVLKLVEVIAKGKISKNASFVAAGGLTGEKKTITWGNHEAVLVHEGVGNAWMLTGWEIK